jgi:hypothetical protein
VKCINGCILFGQKISCKNNREMFILSWQPGGKLFIPRITKFTTVLAAQIIANISSSSKSPNVQFHISINIPKSVLFNICNMVWKCVLPIQLKYKFESIHYNNTKSNCS